MSLLGGSLVCHILESLDVVFIHSKNDKLDPRSKRGVFLGYLEGVKGYRVWVRDEPGFKVVISRDVIFNADDLSCYVSPIAPASSS